MRQFMEVEKFNTSLVFSNTIAWVLGLSGLIAFLVGMLFLIKVAVVVVFT